jgi:hypothetical protein
MNSKIVIVADARPQRNVAAARGKAGDRRDKSEIVDELLRQAGSPDVDPVLRFLMRLVAQSGR